MAKVPNPSPLQSFQRSRAHTGVYRTWRLPFPCLLWLFLLIGIDAYPQAPGEFSHLTDYTHIGLVINAVVGPGPLPGTQRLYASVVGTSRFHLLEIDPDTGDLTVFDSPLQGETAAWGMTVGPDGNIYLGTAPDAHFMRFQVGAGQIADLGRASPSEQWLWSLTVGTDNRVYGGTYPGGKLVRLDPLTSAIDDIGAIDPGQQYLRYVSASRDGIVYMGLGDAPGDIASYDITSGDIHKLLPAASQQIGFAFVYQSTDGFSYGTLSPNAFRLSPSSATQVPWDQRGPPESATTLSDGRILSLDEQDGRLILTESSPGGGSPVAIPLAYSGEPAPLFRIGMGSDGLVYGSASMPSDLVQIDPANGLQRHLGTLGPGEAYSILAYGSQVLFGTYADDPSALALYNPDQPFGSSLESPNPFFISIPNNNDSWRPLALTAASDGTVYVGTEAGYGETTGPLIAWNASWGGASQYDVVPNQSVVSLAISGNLLIGGTCTQTGLGTESSTQAAELFVWDRLSNQTTNAVVPVPDASDINDLVAERDGHVLGIAGNTIFEVDPYSGAILRSQQFPAVPLLYNSAGVDKVDRLWVLSANGVFVVDPTSLHADLIAVPPAQITGGFILANDLVYFTAGPSLYSYRLFGTLAAPVNLTLSTDSLSYGSSLSIHASVQGISTSIPTGSISILADDRVTIQAPLMNGEAEIDLTQLSLGMHSFVAVYSGDSYYAASQSNPLAVVVRTSPRVVITPSAYLTAQGMSIDFVSTVSNTLGDTPVPTGTVQFYDNGVIVGRAEPLIRGKARLLTGALVAGYHNIVATYSGDTNFDTASSPPFTEAVAGIHLTSSVALAVIPDPGFIGVPITVAAEGGFTGVVSFQCSGVPEGVSCSFSPSAVSGSGSTELILASGRGSSVPSARSHTRADWTRLSCGCCGLLLLSFASSRRSIRATIFVAVITFGIGGCGTSYVPAEGRTFYVHVTAEQLCGYRSNNCVGTSSAIDIRAIVNVPRG